MLGRFQTSDFSCAEPDVITQKAPAKPDANLKPCKLFFLHRSWWGPDSRLRHFGDADDEREDYEVCNPSLVFPLCINPPHFKVR